METCLMVPEPKSKCLVGSTCQNVWACGTSREMLRLSTYIYILYTYIIYNIHLLHMFLGNLYFDPPRALSFSE